MTREGLRLRLIALATIVMLAIGGLLAGCAKPDVREVTVIKEVPAPYHLPCPKAGEQPTVPKRVAEEHPAMPKDATGAIDWQTVSRILGAKILELFNYADEADGVMTACSKERGNPL